MCFSILIVSKIYDIEEATGCIDEKPTGAINKAATGVIKAPKNPASWLFFLLFL